ncbi:MAG: nickel pincer cofactor biosynthesis protein LarB, partial [Vicinamibacterales bacterium]
MRDPFSDLEAALSDAADESETSIETRLDPGRQARTGVPEVVFGVGKTDEQVAAACSGLLARLPRVIVSGVERDRIERIVSIVGSDLVIDRPFPGQTCVVARGGTEPPNSCGFVAILTAGTSDLPAAGEAATVAREIGCQVEMIADVGVAGLHRLVQPLRRVISAGVDVIIVAAGMDGA